MDRRMNWIDSVRGERSVRPAGQAANEDPTPPEAARTGWNPYDVWLNRVRGPRKRATLADRLAQGS
jgi:hypothetical protein